MKRLLLVAGMFIFLPIGAMQEGKEGGGNESQKKRWGFFLRKKKGSLTEKKETGTELQDMGVSQEEEKKPDHDSDLPLIEPVQYDAEDKEKADVKKFMIVICKQHDQIASTINWNTTQTDRNRKVLELVKQDVEENKKLKVNILETNKKVLLAMESWKKFHKNVFITYTAAVLLVANIVIHLLMN